MKTKLVLACLLVAVGTTAFSQFLPGRIAVVRVGGSANNGTDGTFIDQFAKEGAGQNPSYTLTVPFGDSESGIPNRICMSGSATSEGGMTRSADGRYLLLPGYRDTAAASVSGTSAPTNPRGFGRISASGRLETAFFDDTSYSGQNIRGVASADGEAVYGVGHGSPTTNGGTRLRSSFSVGSSTAISTGNLRWGNIFFGDLFYSTGSATVGIYLYPGVPTSASPPTLLISTGGSPYGFWFASPTECYVALDSPAATGLRRYFFDGASWTQTHSIDLSAVGGARGLTGEVVGTQHFLYFTTGSAAPNQLRTVAFDTFTSTFGSQTTLATAPASQAFRGVALTPEQDTSQVFENNAAQQVGIWAMDGTSVVSSVALGKSTFQLVGRGDLDGNGTQDLIFRDTATGNFAVWLMKGNAVIGTGLLPVGAVGTNSAFVQAADVNGDGCADLILRDSSSNTHYLWIMQGRSIRRSGTYSMGTLELVGTAAITRDARQSLVWRNNDTGEWRLWTMQGVSGANLNGTEISRNVTLGLLGPAAELSGVTDFDADGIQDLLVFSGSSSEARILYMQTNGTVDAVRVFSLSADWEPVLVGDFAGNSRGGILWENLANNEARLYLMTTRTAYDWFDFDKDGIFENWDARFAVDLNNNGRQDIVWYNPSTNQSAIWMMNGLVVESSAVYGLPVNWSMSEVRGR